MQPKTRLELADMLNEMGLTGEAVEVGVANGYFSFPFLDRWRGRKLYMIDPWREPEPQYNQENVPVDEQLRRLHSVIKQSREKQYINRSCVVRMSSEDACSVFDDGEIDFVYLDGRHDYAGISGDLERWAPKIKVGGILAGHDLLEGNIGGVDYGVERAVAEFAAKRGLTVHAIAEEWPSYYMRIQ